MVGGLQYVVLHVKCDPKRLVGYGAVGAENGPSPLLWPVAYTTACSTVQAVLCTVKIQSGLGYKSSQVQVQQNGLNSGFESKSGLEY